MLDDIYQIPPDQVAAVEWQDDPMYYDLQLYQLGKGNDKFLAILPNNDVEDMWHRSLKHYIEEIPHSRKCIVFTYQGDWVAKLFKDGWYPYHGYETVEIVKPKSAWAKNPELDKLMDFIDDPFGTYEPNKWERDYKLIWYIDPRFNPTDDKIWAMSVQTIGRDVLGTKDMGYLTPNVNIQINDHLPDLGINIDDCCPPFWELANECAYELDPIHQTDQQLWVVKFTPGWRTPKEWKWMGTISPDMHIEYNPILPKLDYELDYTIPWHDLDYEHVWMLDNEHLHPGEEEIWAFKIRCVDYVVGTKFIDFVSPITHWEINSDLAQFKVEPNYKILWHDLKYKHMWYVNINDEKVWAASLYANKSKVKDMGYLIPELPTQLDVVFMSYNEPNADDNWKRLLEFAPNAKRVHGVKGILNAHKAAAKLASTDMFYVVDGDAWLADDWTFDFQPSLYDRDCVYVWNSQNPINGLRYGYGGVKLFPTALLKRTTKWGTDLTTSVGKKLKVIDQVSNITKFNASAFDTWRSAFRECAKLATKNDADSQRRLAQWLTTVSDADYAEYAIAGAKQGKEYAETNLSISLVNDYDWLSEQFKGRSID
jgi:hypothetical protein